MAVPSQWAYHLVLPWMTFALLFAAIYVRMIRANVMDTLGEDYVRTARAKGAPEPQVMRNHVLRNALLPVVTMLGMDIGIALGGAIFTEYDLRPAGPRPARRAGARELRPADDPGRRRLLDAVHHRLQRHRRRCLRLHRSPHSPQLMTQPLLEVDNLKTYFKTDDGIVKAVDGVSFTVGRARRSASSASRARARASPA